MSTTIVETFDRERMRAGLTAGAATVGRPTGVEGKNRTPRRAKMTSKEINHIKTKAGIKAGGPGSGRHQEGNSTFKNVAKSHGFRKIKSGSWNSSHYEKLSNGVRHILAPMGKDGFEHYSGKPLTPGKMDNARLRSDGHNSTLHEYLTKKGL